MVQGIVYFRNSIALLKKETKLLRLVTTVKQELKAVLGV